MLNAFASLKCSEKCQHNVQKPTSRKGRLSLGCSGKGCCEVMQKQMSCFRAFDSNLPVLDVQIMGGGAGWRGAGGGQKKGNRGRDRCSKFKSSSKEGHPLTQSLRSWPSLFRAFRTDPGTGYRLALN